MEIRGKLIKNLIVGGCSYSSYTNVEKNYSTYLSSMLKINNIDGFNAACGSNHRIWRKIFTSIRTGEITSSDLLIIQYTTEERKEIWSKHIGDNFNAGSKRGTLMREPYDDGHLIKFKYNMYGEGSIKQERKLFKLMEENFINSTYENEIFENTHMGLVNLLESNQINTIFLGTQYRSNINIYNSEFCKYIEILGIENSDICLSPSDCHHLSEKGHHLVAKIIYDNIMNYD